jgi:hypothetical protein
MTGTARAKVEFIMPPVAGACFKKFGRAGCFGQSLQVLDYRERGRTEGRLIP